ncbi:YitT family protein [Streptococcus ovis]|uniref:YitT family protein n=1 Tax=Streptococcus ovis TaxID=82806 RepID=UPI0005A8F076|nr:YitT family protein [Streptococcus ovis]
MIALGAAIYAFGFVYFYMANKVAGSGIAGLTLIFHNLFGVNPTYSGYFINFPLVLLGAYLFGRKAMVYTVEGIASLYFFVWFFQKIPFSVDLGQDYLVISLISGIIGGLGGGIVFRYGGTIGGSDIVARVIEDKLGIQLNQALLAFDIFVMVLSLTYISLPKMMYALIASFMYSQVVKLVQNGGYSVRGMMVISDQADSISREIIEKLGRGVTYLRGEGAYSGKEKKVLYVALSPQDVREAKVLIHQLDESAFISIFNIDEVQSPEFIAARSKYRKRIR